MLLKRLLGSGAFRASVWLLIFGMLTLPPIGTATRCCAVESGDDGSSGGGSVLEGSSNSDEDPGSEGSDQAASGVFDTSESFVPPADLPIQDVYVKDVQSMSNAELADQLETVSVTPDGETESSTVSAEDAAAFRTMLKTLSIQDAGQAESGMLGDAEFDGPAAESVIDADTRTRVNNTTAYPFRTVGRIDIGCTGTLIGKRHVLTAGHCVYNIRTDKWYRNLDFSPGQNGSSRPYGKIGWKKAISVKGWTQDHQRNSDYAMIILKTDIGNTTGTMGYGWKNPMPKYNVNINGYPGDKPFGTMWHSYGKLQIITNARLYYALDTYGGMSGSGVYVYFSADKKRTIYGIHAYGVDSTGYNGATRITKTVFEKLKKWKADN